MQNTDTIDAECPAVGFCALDEPIQRTGLVVPTTGTLSIAGWAFAAVRQPVPTSVSLEIRSESLRTVETVPAVREQRPDVASHYRDPGLLMAGFRASIALTPEMFGRYSISVVQMQDSRCYRSDAVLGFEIKIQPYETTARTGLAAKFLTGHGIEIGALQRRLTVPPSCAVTYVDRMPYAELITHYPELRGLAIQEPDVIDDGEKLHRFADASQDFVIANHLLEHCQDPIRTIFTFLRVLKPGGILYMAVPDKRYTFDHSRPVTPYQELHRAYATGQRSNISALYREWASHVHQLRGPAAEEMASDLEAREYSIHYNVWALSDLISFLLNARTDFRMPFEIASVVMAENEVILVLQRLRTAE